jgi:hypothetical protein
MTSHVEVFTSQQDLNVVTQARHDLVYRKLVMVFLVKSQIQIFLQTKAFSQNRHGRYLKRQPMQSLWT